MPVADLTALDGNAIGGLLYEVFGKEMTTAVGECAHCGSRRQAAETMVYLRAPGTIVRCRVCHGVLMAFTRHHGMICVDLTGLSDLAV